MIPDLLMSPMCFLFWDPWGDCDDVTGSGYGPFNYGEALQKSLDFYYAQRAGDLEEAIH